jgi:hypothetical protein
MIARAIVIDAAAILEAWVGAAVVLVVDMLVLVVVAVAVVAAEVVANILLVPPEFPSSFSFLLFFSFFSFFSFLPTFGGGTKGTYAPTPKSSSSPK